MTHALTTVDRHTGEVTPIQHFSIVDYLAGVSTPSAFEHQQRLAAAYDAACHALVGPNDVQVAEGRSFKKKSAWRKLARHFTISVACDPKEARIEQMPDGGWVAIAGAVASAPWGQTFSDVGACGSDEATGRRTISYADGLATAMTRASNRAVSNLIAMGEVSAEEIGNRKPYAAPRSSGGPTTGAIMPFGKSKGRPLSSLSMEDLEGALQWAMSKQKFEEFQKDAESELRSRSQSQPQPPDDPEERDEDFR